MCGGGGINMNVTDNFEEINMNLTEIFKEISMNVAADNLKKYILIPHSHIFTCL